MSPARLGAPLSDLDTPASVLAAIEAVRAAHPGLTLHGFGQPRDPANVAPLRADAAGQR